MNQIIKGVFVPKTERRTNVGDPDRYKIGKPKTPEQQAADKQALQANPENVDYEALAEQGKIQDIQAIKAAERLNKERQALARQAVQEIKAAIKGEGTFENSLTEWVKKEEVLKDPNLNSLAEKAGFEEFNAGTYQAAREKLVKLESIKSDIQSDLDDKDTLRPSGILGGVKSFFSSKERGLKREMENVQTQINSLRDLVNRIEDQFDRDQRVNLLNENDPVERPGTRPEDAVDPQTAAFVESFGIEDGPDEDEDEEAGKDTVLDGFGDYDIAPPMILVDDGSSEPPASTGGRDWGGGRGELVPAGGVETKIPAGGVEIPEGQKLETGLLFKAELSDQEKIFLLRETSRLAEMVKNFDVLNEGTDADSAYESLTRLEKVLEDIGLDSKSGQFMDLLRQAISLFNEGVRKQDLKEDRRDDLLEKLRMVAESVNNYPGFEPGGEAPPEPEEPVTPVTPIVPPVGLVGQNPERGRDGSGEEEREANGVERRPLAGTLMGAFGMFRRVLSSSYETARDLGKRAYDSLPDRRKWMRLLPIALLLPVSKCEIPDVGEKPVVEEIETPDGKKRSVTAQSIENPDGTITIKIEVLENGERVDNPEVENIPAQSFSVDVNNAVFELASQYLPGQGELTEKGAKELKEQMNGFLQIVASNIEAQLIKVGLKAEDISALQLADVKLPSGFIERYGALIEASGEGNTKGNLGKNTTDTRSFSVKTATGLEVQFTADNIENKEHYEEILAVAVTDAELAKLIDKTASSQDNINRILKEIRMSTTGAELKAKWQGNPVAETIIALDRQARSVSEVTLTTFAFQTVIHGDASFLESPVNRFESSFDPISSMKELIDAIEKGASTAYAFTADQLIGAISYLRGVSSVAGPEGLSKGQEQILKTCEIFQNEDGILDLDGVTYIFEVKNGMPSVEVSSMPVQKGSDQKVDHLRTETFTAPNGLEIDLVVGPEGNPMFPIGTDIPRTLGIDTEVGGLPYAVDLSASAETAPGVTSDGVAREVGVSPEVEAAKEGVDFVQLEADVIDAVKQRGREALKDLIAKTSDKQALRSVVQQLRETSDRELAEEGISLTSTNRSKLALMISEIDRGA